MVPSRKQWCIQRQVPWSGKEGHWMDLYWQTSFHFQTPSKKLFQDIKDFQGFPSKLSGWFCAVCIPLVSSCLHLVSLQSGKCK